VSVFPAKRRGREEFFSASVGEYAASLWLKTGFGHVGDFFPANGRWQGK
jgi:hypothetical protein